MTCRGSLFVDRCYAPTRKRHQVGSYCIGAGIIGDVPRSVAPKQPAPDIQPDHFAIRSPLPYPSRSGDMPLSEAFDLPAYRFDGLCRHINDGEGRQALLVLPIFDKKPAITSRVNLFWTFHPFMLEAIIVTI